MGRILPIEIWKRCHFQKLIRNVYSERPFSTKQTKRSEYYYNNEVRSGCLVFAGETVVAIVSTNDQNWGQIEYDVTGTSYKKRGYVKVSTTNISSVSSLPHTSDNGTITVTPKVGDVAFIYRSSTDRANHIGIVVALSRNTVTTVEGNTYIVSGGKYGVHKI